MGEHVSDDAEIKALTHDHDCDGDCVGAAPDCVDGLAHAWVGVGGCTENPGVQSLGGTTFVWDAECRWCGVRRRVTQYGWQRNPGECDTITWDGVAEQTDAAVVELRRIRRNRLAARSRLVSDPMYQEALVAARAGSKMRAALGMWERGQHELHTIAARAVHECRLARRRAHAARNFRPART